MTNSCYVEKLEAVAAIAREVGGRRVPAVVASMVGSLTDAEYAYAIRQGGEGFFEYSYGVEFNRL